MFQTFLNAIQARINKEAGQRFQAFLNIIPDPAFVIDPGRVVLIANDALCQQLSKGLSEIIGHSISELFAPDLADRMKACIDEGIRTGKLSRFEHMREDRCWEYRVYPILGEERTVDKAVVFALDATKHKKGMWGLQGSQERLLRMFESVKDRITVVDLNSVILEASEVAARNSGFASKGELLEKSGVELVGPRDHERMLQSMKETQPQGSIGREEFPPIKAEGSECSGEASSRVLEDSSGNPIAFSAVTRDFIQRRKEELSHQESEEEFRSLYFTINEGVYLAEIVYDESGKPIDYLARDINPAMESITGFKRSEVVGRLASDIMTPPFLHIHAKVADSGEPISYEIYFAPLGKHFQVSAFSTAKGRIAVVFSDVTKYKEIEAQLLAHQKELRSLASKLTLAEERERRRIANGIHDSISQKLAVCKMKLGALGASASLAGIDKPLAEIRALIEQIIEESRSMTFELSSPLLYAFGLKAASEQLTQQMEKEFGCPFRFEDDGQPKPLDQDVRVLLFQVVRELLMNIIKHARARNAKVVMRRDGSNLIIVVEDDGIGFDASEIGSMGRITKGFGLFGIRERLHYIHGNIEVDSKPGQGTQVTITAPLKSEPEE